MDHRTPDEIDVLPLPTGSAGWRVGFMAYSMRFLAAPTAHPGKQICSWETKERWYEHAQFSLPNFMRQGNGYTYLSDKIELESQHRYISSASPYIKENIRNEEETLPSNSQQPSYHLLIIW